MQQEQSTPPDPPWSDEPSDLTDALAGRYSCSLLEAVGMNSLRRWMSLVATALGAIRSAIA